MMTYDRGDIVLVDFVFTDESGQKRRPALIVSSPVYHPSRQEAIVAAITSSLARNLLGDQIIADWRAAGLAVPSAVTGVLRTIKRTMVRRRLGAMTESDLRAFDQQLRQSLAL